MDWSAVALRVVVEACTAHPQDVVLILGAGDGALARALAPRVRRVVVVDPHPPPLADLPPNVELRAGDLLRPPTIEGLSVVALHWSFRRLPPAEQPALIRALGALLPPRGLLVLGDILWSMPAEMIDEPEQYGDHLEHAPTARQAEGWLRRAGFLPDVHRFGPAVTVIIALRDGR